MSISANLLPNSSSSSSSSSSSVSGATSELPTACYLSSSFFYPRNSLPQPTEHDHENDDEGRGRFGAGGALKQVSL